MIVYSTYLPHMGSCISDLRKQVIENLEGGRGTNRFGASSQEMLHKEFLPPKVLWLLVHYTPGVLYIISELMQLMWQRLIRSRDKKAPQSCIFGCVASQLIPEPLKVQFQASSNGS